MHRDNDFAIDDVGRPGDGVLHTRAVLAQGTVPLVVNAVRSSWIVLSCAVLLMISA